MDLVFGLRVTAIDRHSLNIQGLEAAIAINSIAIGLPAERLDKQQSQYIFVCFVE